jgi:hypothetical protein
MARCVECLACGLQRLITEDPGECARCGYLGWAPLEAVSEELRRSLRDVPVEARRPTYVETPILQFRPTT